MRITTTVLAVLAVFSINSQAGVVDQNDRLNHNFGSKLPYQVAPEKNTYQADDKWEGATLQGIDGPNGTDAKAEKNEKQLNLHFLGRRPHMEKGNTD
jgi:hypothetical protein